MGNLLMSHYIVLVSALYPFGLLVYEFAGSIFSAGKRRASLSFLLCVASDLETPLRYHYQKHLDMQTVMWITCSKMMNAAEMY